MQSPTSNADVLIVGGGLAGLACARQLHQHGVSSRILEAFDTVGGRVRTETVDGFLLDRGFQVLLTAYPEAQRVLDYARLDLRAFFPGALIYSSRRFQSVADPIRKPLQALKALFSSVATMGDKVRLLSLRQRLAGESLETIFGHPERTTIDALHAEGFSPAIVSTFFRPFLSGIFLDKDLKTSSRMFEFVFKMFSLGDAALPAGGMGAIPAQLAETLPHGTIRLRTRVGTVDGNTVTLESGERLKARAVVVATEGPEAERLISGLGSTGSRSATCLYFAADRDPIGRPVLLLNGDSSGPINHLCVPSTVAPSYAPAGSALISVSVPGNPDENDESLESGVRAQLTSWFGGIVRSWKHLRTFRIIHALPVQVPPALSPVERPVKLHDGLYICGDHRDTASIEGALVSGRRAADAVLNDFKSQPLD